ncbi:hypothetical protein K4F52_000126 [Lecanicillium sp. MT-2017a]|nr:hypothetical protein K4F52_000126 [Lecanicillium sp. MT-2017a]
MAASLRDSTLVQMMNSGQYSDMSLSCNGEIFKVHKAVVVGQSDVIKAAAEGNFREARTNNIALDGYQPAGVKRLVQFLYTGDYDDPDQHFDGTFHVKEEPSDDNAAPDATSQPATEGAVTAAELIAGHIRMNGIGDYLRIAELAALAKDKLESLVHHESPDQSWVAHLPALSRAAAQLTADKSIVAIMTSCIADNLAALIKVSSLQESDMISDFALQILTRANEITQSLGEAMVSTQRKLTETNALLLGCRVNCAKLIKSVTVLNGTAKCRNTSCSSTFGGYVDITDGAIRCRVCKCRHVQTAPATSTAKSAAAANPAAATTVPVNPAAS